jgi:hypothetical protein
MNVFTKENAKHVLGALKGYKEGVEENSRRSCHDVALKFFKNRQKIHPIVNRKEGLNL